MYLSAIDFIKNKLFRIFFIIVLGIMNISEVYAKVRLPQLVSDKMVLQRDTALKIWGWADKGEIITLKFLGKTYNAKPDLSGKWFVVLPPQKYGGPFIMEINEIIIRDILIGDVWLASGQSNMETPIGRLTDRFPEINVSDNNKIRYFKVPTQDATASVRDKILEGGKWYTGTASEVMNWTALSFFYAQKAYNQTGVPQGMLVSSRGGSAIERWISQEHLKQFPKLVFNTKALQGLKEAEKDKGVGKWDQLGFDDSQWETTKIPGTWKENGIQKKGTIWYRKSFEIPSSKAGKYAKVYLGVLVDSDSVFVNGKFVGSTSYTYPPRKYNIPAGILKKGKNNITIKLTSNSGNGGFVKDKPYKIVCEDLEIDLQGIWKYKIGIDLNKIKKYQTELNAQRRVGSGLYNGMIYPLRDYKVRGAIWYQGESNSGQPELYETYLTLLIKNWRELFEWKKMPFLLVQLPNFMKKTDNPNSSGGWVGVREAQFKVSKQVPYTALAVTYDVGVWNDIHPLNKKDIAHRLFIGARKIVYGEKITASGPVYQSMNIEGSNIVLSFTEVGEGLVSKGGVLNHFAIAGEDKNFVWANAVIKGGEIIVSSKAIKKPVAVRYAWSNNPEDANLCNKEGLLASPFRTDNW